LQLSLPNGAVATDRNQWRVICGFEIPIVTKETPTSSRQDIWAELRYGTEASYVQNFMEIPDKQMKQTIKEKNKDVQSDQPA
jgi:hypothetical protein